MPRTGNLLLTLIVASACRMTAFAADPPPSDADRLKVVEKQLAELKKEMSDLREMMKLPPKTTTNKKLYGTWSMEKPPEAKFAGIVAVVLNEDGTYDVAWQSETGLNQTWSGKFKVVGKVVELTHDTFSVRNVYLHVTTVDDKELVGNAKQGEAGGDIKLQRQ